MNSLRTYETWDTSPAQPPARSRLNCLQPIGAWTPYVESLTGYVARLAESHSVTSATLFGWELAPLTNKASINRMAEERRRRGMILASSFASRAPAMDGFGSTAAEWVEILGALTLRRDLRQLTMLTWRNVLSHKHLVRRTRAWCPRCFEGWRARGQPAYEPLLWSLAAVTTCHVHERRLQFTCPRCGRRPHLLSSKSRPGHCSVCGCWLGDVSGPQGDSWLPQGEDLEPEVWAAHQVGSLLAHAAEVSQLPPRVNIAESFGRCVDLLTGGRMRALSRQLCVSKGGVRRWRSGEGLPTLGTLVIVCRGLGIPVLDFIKGTFPLKQNVRAKERYVQRTRESRSWKRLDLNQAEEELKASQSVSPAPSLKEVARRIGREPSTLRYRFPGLCRAVVRRYLRRVRASGRKNFGQPERALRTELWRPDPQSVEAVARKYGMSGSTLRTRHPELCRELTRYHAARRKEAWSEVEIAARTSLEQKHPPPSLREFARHLGYSYKTLQERLPELCQLVISRAAEYRTHRAAERRRELEVMINEVALEIHREGEYPSVKRVQERVGVAPSLRSSRVALNALRIVRHELGLVSPAFTANITEGRRINL